MSGIEIVGLVFGAFPIILSGLEAYSKGFEPLEEWWQFSTRFKDFTDDVEHQMMKYHQNMMRLLDPIIICTEGDKLAALLEIPNRTHPEVDLESILKGRLANELDRFLRIVHRMHELMLALNKLLQIEDGRLPWLGTDEQRSWQWHLKRMQISFSKGKHSKVKKLAEHNKKLEDILGYSEHIMPLADKRKTSEPVTHLENLRKHAYAIHRTLAKQWRCQRNCQTHAAHLSLRAEVDTISANVIFRTKVLPQSLDATWVREVVITQDESVRPPISIDVGRVRWADLSPAVQKTMLQQEPVTQAMPSLKVGMLKKLQDRMSAIGPSSSRHRRPPSTSIKPEPGLGIDTTKASSTSPTMFEKLKNSFGKKSLPRGTVAEVKQATGPCRGNTMGFGPIGDLCAFLTEQNQIVGTLDEEDSQRTLTFSKLSDGRQQQVKGKARLHTFSELLDAHHQMKINISRRARFEIATHIASALLQAHLSPWLSPKWTKNDFYFFVDMKASSISSIYPSVCREFTARPEITLQDNACGDQNSDGEQDNEEETRTRLFTLGVMILELMFGHTIEACQFRREYLGADGRPNDQTDASTARRWSRRVLGESGADMSDVVRRCLDCSFGPQPSFADGRFREAVYAGVILPLASYTKLWPEVMP